MEWRKKAIHSLPIYPLPRSLVHSLSYDVERIEVSDQQEIVRVLPCHSIPVLILVYRRER